MIPNPDNLRPLNGCETILVVDDEVAVLSVTELILKRSGYTVITAKGAHEVLRLLEESTHLIVDLLLIDFALPAMHGVDLAGRIRSLRPETPILYFSGYSQHEER